MLSDAEALKQIEIDLESQRVVRECGTSYSFDVDPFRKHCLLNGLDDIGLTLQKMDAIRSFETERSQRYPWLDGATTRVPKLFAAAGQPELENSVLGPSPEDWRAEVMARRQALQAAAA